MTWLKEGIERVLNAQGKGDVREYASAYDDCLWRITTSGKAELEEFATKAWDFSTNDHNNLPVPLLVLICRLYVLECRKRTPEVEYAINYIAAHCSSGAGGEEEGATGGFIFSDGENV